MVDLEKLRQRGLYAYEKARLYAAARVAFYVLPVLAACWWQSSDRESCVCLAAVLIGATTWLRWRDRRSSRCNARSRTCCNASSCSHPGRRTGRASDAAARSDQGHLRR
jgi:hypothetical protein